MPADPPQSPSLRASDADRDRFIEVLRAAAADGRLDQAEFDERLDAALAVAASASAAHRVVQRDARPDHPDARPALDS